MTVGTLRKLIYNLPDEAEIGYTDPNYGGSYCIEPEEFDFTVENGKLFIGFPFESPVDDDFIDFY